MTDMAEVAGVVTARTVASQRLKRRSPHTGFLTEDSVVIRDLSECS